VTAGLITGCLALVPALALLWTSGGFAQAGNALGLPHGVVASCAAALFLAAGALYGRIFMRAANDFRGGWLFGISFGFLLWMLGPATFLQWFLGQPLAMGTSAQAIFLAHLAYGVALGFLFPLVHRRFMDRLPDPASDAAA
jgi:hypothetical protein